MLWRLRDVAALVAVVMLLGGLVAAFSGSTGCGGSDIVIGSTTIPIPSTTGTPGTPGGCRGLDQPCARPADCCSGLCQGAICDCASRTEFCTANAQCCNANCNFTFNQCN